MPGSTFPVPASCPGLVLGPGSLNSSPAPGPASSAPSVVPGWGPQQIHCPGLRSRWKTQSVHWEGCRHLLLSASQMQADMQSWDTGSWHPPAHHQHSLSLSPWAPLIPAGARRFLADQSQPGPARPSPLLPLFFLPPALSLSPSLSPLPLCPSLPSPLLF